MQRACQALETDIAAAKAQSPAASSDESEGADIGGSIDSTAAIDIAGSAGEATASEAAAGEAAAGEATAVEVTAGEERATATEQAADAEG